MNNWDTFTEWFAIASISVSLVALAYGLACL